MSSNGNVRRIMLKHKRRAKCPLLKKFIEEALVPSEGNFLATEELFEEWKRLVALWTDGDTLNGQTKTLMKRNSFNRVSELSTGTYDSGGCLGKLMI